MNQTESKSVLFVCMGNICRSPTAEGVFEKLVSDKGLQSRVRLDSAGTIGFHAGKPADSRMQVAAAEKGYQLNSVSRKVTVDDFSDFDLIVAMDRENFSDLSELMPDPSRAELKLLSDYLGDEWPTDVPDPYYGGESGFTYVVEMVEEACGNLLRKWVESES